MQRRTMWLTLFIAFVTLVIAALQYNRDESGTGYTLYGKYSTVNTHRTKIRFIREEVIISALVSFFIKLTILNRVGH